ncbi:hypothetical protein ABE430_13770 [Brevibacillus agri]|uniref:hypothetical protein n=1 Tax=Brevibacillus agri TaxID=51101 RepID=UPI003D214300
MLNREQTKAWRNLTTRQRGMYFDLSQNAVIKDGRVYDVDGNDRTHIAQLGVRVPEHQVKWARIRSEMACFAEENGGYVSAVFKSCVTMIERFPSLSQSDYAVLMLIGTYVAYRTGRLEHDNGHAIDRNKLVEIIGLSERKFRDLYGALLAEEIIREEGAEIYVNPSVFYRGSHDDAEFDLTAYQHARLYRGTVRELYRRYRGRELRQLAIIYAILPFLNYNTNVVCFNPQEQNKDGLRPLYLDKLAALLGYKDVTKFKRALNAIELNGKPVFTFTEDPHDRRKKRVVVNPRVVFAGNAEGLSAIKVLFN